MSTLRHADVFVPGGFPVHTYNPRETQQLENRLRLAKDNLCKLVTVTGHTKSGKTVLVRNVFPREDAIWIDGGMVSTEEVFWSTVIDELELFQSSESITTSESSGEIKGSGKAAANFLVAMSEAELGASIGTRGSTELGQSRQLPSKVAAVKGIREAGIPLVIDDFH